MEIEKDAEDIKEINNFLPQEYSDRLLNVVSDNSNFPWFYNESIVSGEKDMFGFSHVLFVDDKKNSPFFDEFIDFFSYMEENLKIKIKKIIRARIRMTTGIGKNKPFENNIHVDYFYPNDTLVYYLNDSDGDTILFDKFYGENHLEAKEVKRVSPLKNNAVTFDGLRFHSGAMPTNERRLILNINFEKKD